MGSCKRKAQSEILWTSGKAQRDSRTRKWDQRNSTSCLRPGLGVYYWTNSWGQGGLWRPSFTTATHGSREKGKSYKCHQRGVAEMASCPNPVPLLPGHVQTDPISQPLQKLTVAKQPMEQTDMDPLKPLTHNPSCSFPSASLSMQTCTVTLGPACWRWQSSQMEGASVSESPLWEESCTTRGHLF